MAAHDDDRAVGLSEQPVTHAPQDKLLQAVPVGADDQEVRLKKSGLVDERLDGGTLEQQGFGLQSLSSASFSQLL